MVAEHWAAFVEHTEEQGRPLPSFVQREVEAYLRCGILEHGLLRLGCPACGFERLVAFSCCLQLKIMRRQLPLLDEAVSGYGTLEWRGGAEYCG